MYLPKFNDTGLMEMNIDKIHIENLVPVNLEMTLGMEEIIPVDCGLAFEKVNRPKKKKSKMIN